MDSLIPAIIGAIVGAALSMWISQRIQMLDALKTAAKTEMETLQELKRALRRLWEASFSDSKFARKEFDAVDILANDLSSAVLKDSIMKGAEAQLFVKESNEEDVSKLFQKTLADIKRYEKNIHEMYGGKSWEKRIKKIEGKLKKPRG